MTVLLFSRFSFIRFFFSYSSLSHATCFKRRGQNFIATLPFGKRAHSSPKMAALGDNHSRWRNALNPEECLVLLNSHLCLAFKCICFHRNSFNSRRSFFARHFTTFQLENISNEKLILSSLRSQTYIALVQRIFKRGVFCFAVFKFCSNHF